ncbi:MAG: hypothetical protein HYS64_06480, partial [Rhodospirillales bacterium]|nr:hypothetical protein [Rhodospirillales bacterium]
MPKHRLSTLERSDEFVRRHLGPGTAQIAEMLATLGLGSLDELIQRAVPADIASKKPLKLPPARSERDTLSALRAMADLNQVRVS